MPGPDLIGSDSGGPPGSVRRTAPLVLLAGIVVLAPLLPASRLAVEPARSCSLRYVEATTGQPVRVALTVDINTGRALGRSLSSAGQVRLVTSCADVAWPVPVR